MQVVSIVTTTLHRFRNMLFIVPGREYRLKRSTETGYADLFITEWCLKSDHDHFHRHHFLFIVQSRPNYRRCKCNADEKRR
jgi:hypothetical protein